MRKPLQSVSVTTDRSGEVGWQVLSDPNDFTDFALIPNRTYFEEWCLLGCYAVKTSNLTQDIFYFVTICITVVKVLVCKWP
jgi:hypothetical protein